MVFGYTLSTNAWYFDSTYDDLASPCIVTASGLMSFGEAAARARRLRAFITSRLPDAPSHEPARVAYVAHPDPDVHVLFLTLFGMGLTAVPLHPKLTRAEVDVLSSVARPDLVLDADEIARAAEDTSYDSGGPERATAPDPESPVTIVFTSGTTGRPKGALLSRRAFLASARASAQVLGWQPDDRWFLCMPLAHVGGLGVLVRCLLAKKAVIHFGRRAFDPTEALSLMKTRGATIASLVPTMLARFVEANEAPNEALRTALLGGAAASPTLVAKGRALGWPLVITYGLTEACSHVTLGATSDTGRHVGRPIPGTDVRIVDGQVTVRSATLFSGYVDQGPLQVDADGFYATGDLGEVDAAGHLAIHARRTDLVVTGGENVYPREIELLVEEIAGVKEAAVFGVPDETWGQLVALAVVVEAGGPDLATIMASLKLRTASHKRPRLGVIVDALPTNTLGKIVRPRLTELVPRLARIA
jgi:O-succinylbenzoic acid--CoA ligase